MNNRLRRIAILMLTLALTMSLYPDGAFADTEQDDLTDDQTLVSEEVSEDEEAESDVITEGAEVSPDTVEETAAAEKPGTVTLKTVSVKSSSIELELSRADNADLYEVYCSSDGGQSFDLLTGTDALTYKHTGLEAEHEYIYYVVAINSNNGSSVKGDASEQIIQKTAEPMILSVPSASAKLTYGKDDSGVTISWTMKDTTGVSYYEVLRGTSSNVSSMTPVGTTEVGNLTFRYAEKANGTFYYAVRACGEDGGSSISRATDKVKISTSKMKVVKHLVWRCTARSNVSLMSAARGKTRVGSVKKGEKLTAVGKYPAHVAKFHQPTWVKVRKADGTTGWLKYSQLRGGVKAIINIGNDYTRSAKEDYVNSMGYTSSTDYLFWLNTYTQRVYTFKGSKGNWKLVRSDRATTGRFSHSTPNISESARTEKRGQIYKRRGKVNMVQENGKKYYFRKASYFSPGISFHTGTWWASGKRRGSVTRKPDTFGCIRMYDKAAAAIYKYPMYSSVIVN